MFLVNSRYPLFSATPSWLPKTGYSLSRSYGVILPSSLTRVLSSALGFSPHLPVSVLVRSLTLQPNRGFSWKSFRGVRSKKSSIRDLDLSAADLPTADLRPETPTITRAILFRPSSPLSVHASGAGILTCCPSTTPFGLALGVA